MSLKQWVRDTFDDLELLEISTFQYRPGVILKPHGSSEIRSAAWTLLNEGVTDAFWATRRGPALVPERSFEEERSGGGSIKIPGILAITLRDERKITASFTAEDVEVELFATVFESDIDAKLRTKFKHPGNHIWIQFIDNHRVVTECWFMRHLRVTFSSAGKRMAKVDVEQRVNIGAEGSTEWHQDETLEIRSTGTVPFAVRTFRP